MIAWLGLAFSPVWCGVMAAMNAKRLGLKSPAYRPILIGVGSVFLSVLVELLWFESWLFNVLLYCGAIWVIWMDDLLSQVVTYEQQPKDASDFPDHWIAPTLSGLPLGLMVIVVLVVAPLLPLSPREVCEEFVAAGSAQERKQHSTNKLWPALDPLGRVFFGGPKGSFELLDEAQAPPDMGGYFVAYRVVVSPNNTVAEGVFHLVAYSGPWKVEEIYLTTINGVEQSQWPAVSRDYRELFPAGTVDASIASTGSGTPKKANSDTVYKDYWKKSVFVLAAWKLGKWGFVVLAVLLSGLIALLRGDKPSQSETEANT